MKYYGIATLLAVALVAGCAAPAKTRISCTNADVILTPEQIDTMLIKSGADAKQICEVADKIDASTYVEPTKVNVVMPSGQNYDVEMQARAQ